MTGNRLIRSMIKVVLGAAAVLVFIWTADWVLKPLHARGRFQSLLSPVIGTADMLTAPGRRLALLQTWRPGQPRPYKPPQKVVVFYHVLVYLSAAGMVMVLLRMRSLINSWRAENSEPERPALTDEPMPLSTSVDPERNAQKPLSRRAFLRVGPAGAVALLGATTVGGTGAYALLIEPNRLPVSWNRFGLRGLPPELTGLRVVHLTDIHHGPWLSTAFVHRVVQKTNALKPDLVVITGDHVVAGDRYITPAAQELSLLRPRIGVLCTLGNHDWWAGEGKVRDAFRRAELPLIDNSRMFLSTDRRLSSEPARDGRGLCVAGVGDFWEDQTDFAGALRPAPDDMPRLLLSHNPDTAESPALLGSGERVDLMLCGHTHGGQIHLPFLGPPAVPSRYGSRYAKGLVQGPACPVYISRGIGMTVLPVRLGAPPEIAVFDFFPA